MKNIFLFLLTLFASDLLGQNMDLVKPENRWNIYYSRAFSPITYTRQFAFTNEVTVIEEEEYFELLMAEEEDGPFESFGKYFRQDDEKVYEYKFGKEQLIYDFGMEVGDSITYDVDGEKITLVMWAIEIVEMLDQSLRRRYTLRCTNDQDGADYIWWEGIGTSIGIGNENTQCRVDVPTELSCFFSDNIAVYENDMIGDCWKVDNRELQKDLYRIFPNPVQDYLNIEDLNTPFEYAIKTMEGKIIQRGQGEQRIEVQQLPVGMYFLEIMTENKIGVMKFVKR